MIKYIVVILISITFLSCNKDELGPQCLSCENEHIDSQVEDVLLVNEGNFGFGNASISLYQPNIKSVSNNIFQQVNSTPLGDVAQSITQIGNLAYIIVNNSNKIEVVDVHSFTSIHTITGFNSPRYMLPINTSKAYVTDLYANAISIVNLNTGIITGNIPVNGWTEKLIKLNDTVYVCDMTNDNLLIIDPLTDLLIDSVKVGVSPNSIVKDADNKLWVLCDGGFAEDTPKLIKFNPQNRTIENTFIFNDINNSPGNLKINLSNGELYYINSDVFKMSVNSTSLPTIPLIPSNSNNFYSLGLDTLQNEIYIADAIDYIQNSLIYRYTTSGSLVDQFNGGIIAGNFHFVK